MRWFDRFRKQPKNVASPSELDALVRAALSAPAASGITVTPMVAMEDPTVAGCVRALSEMSAVLPVSIVKRGENGKREVIENVDAHRILRVKPNRWQTPYQFRRLIVARAALYGNFYAVKNRLSSGKLVEVNPIAAERVEVTQERDFSLKYKISDQGDAKELSAAEVFHFYGLSLDGYQGLDPTRIWSTVIGLSIALDRHASYLFKNAARPSGILSTDEMLDDAKITRIAESWKAAHGGDKSFGTAVLDGGMKYLRTTLSSQETEAVNLRKQMRSILAGVWRVPPHMIGDLEKATFSNIENLSRQFVDYALVPWLTDLEQAYELHLLTQRQREMGLRIRHDVKGLLRGDAKTRAAFYKSGVETGWMNRNEVRSKEDMDPGPEELDEYLEPMNFRPAGEDPPPEPEPVIEEDDDEA